MNRATRPLLFAGIMVALVTLRVAAAPFENLQISFDQPDGTTIELVGSGDEFYAVFETAEGYTAVFDPERKAYCFGRQNGRGELISTGVQVHRGNPANLGVNPHERMSPKLRQQQIRQRRESWDREMEVKSRWSEQKQATHVSSAAASGASPSDFGPIEPRPPSKTTTGLKVGLCLLIDFDDAPATIPRAEIVNFCNADSYTSYGNFSSVKKYFQNVSNGQLTYSNVVTVYIRIPNSLHPRSYYNDTTKDCGAQGNLLIRDALNLMKALPNYTTEILPTFNNLTVDSNNRLVACNVFFAGGSSGVWSKGLWPHSWSLYNVGAQSLSTGGKQIYRYQITHIGSSLAIGTFCHENGHMLCGFPDIYDYDYDSRGGAGNYCLMGTGNSANGGRCPVQVSAYLKRAAGWATTIALTSNSVMTATVTAVPGTNFNNFYRLPKPGVNTEYFIVEGRFKTGHDTYLPGSGVAIWHVDELGDHDNQSLAPNITHANYELTLVQADNRWDLQNNANSGDSKDLYYSGNTAAGYANQFTDTSSPNARWWDGTNSGVKFTSFSPAAATMSFTVGNGPVIVSQPLDQTVTMGNNATFSVGATGSGLSYQWRFHGTNLVGATRSSLTRTNVQPADAGPYAVMVSNLGGSTLSASATLTVNALPIITAQPQDAETALGLNATFSVEATSPTPITYQWQFYGTNLIGATSRDYTITNAQPENQGPYTVLLTNIYGWLQSSTGFLRIVDPFIAGQPQTRVGLIDGTVEFHVTAVGTMPMSYQWWFDGAELAGATNSSLVLTNLVPSHMGFYSVVVNNTSGTNVSQPAALVLEGLPPLLVRKPESRTISAGASTEFTVQALGVGPLAYQWSRSGIPLSDAGNILGATSSTLSISSVQAVDMGVYSVVVTNAFGQASWSNLVLHVWPVLGWGQNTFGQANIPAIVTNVVMLAAGSYHSVALNDDGTVSAWGAGLINSGSSPHFGQALVPSTVAEASSGELGGTIAVAAGAYHSLALKADGKVVAWGAGTANTGSGSHFGQASVPAGLSNVVAIAGGGYSSLALRSDGTIIGWGAGVLNSGVSPHFGQAHPPAGLSKVIRIAAGSYHALALREDGTVATWGANAYGQTNIPTALADVVAIAAGSDHSLALQADGTVVAWGRNNAGQTNVPAGLSNIVAIAAGLSHSLALQSDGTLIGWGLNTFSQNTAPAGAVNIAGMAAGGSHSLLIQSDGRPQMTVQPVSRNVSPGSPIRLTALATGSPPLTYQWLRNGVPVTEGVNSTLVLNEVQLQQAGDYIAIISNGLGSVTSAVATVTIPIVLLESPQYLVGNGLECNVVGVPGRSYIVQSSSDLQKWAAVHTNTSPFIFRDPQAQEPARFYRVQQAD